MNHGARQRVLPLALLWSAALLAAAIVWRPLTPVDETRYAAVAWEIWLSGDWISLRLNGDLYGHKPPLLFWLINLGWQLFGVNEWWPRLLSGLFGIGALGLVLRLARRLAPGREDVAAMALLVSGSSLYWMGFTGAVMFDLMLSFFVLVGISAVAWAGAGGGPKAWLLAGLAMGLGILTKGPVALLHVLPVALLAPWWWPGSCANPRRAFDRRRWYGGVALAVLVAALVALAWAVPTAVAGGEAFRREIFWSQSVDRIASTVHHLQPWWFYFAALPALLAPWLLLPAVWRGLPALARNEVPLDMRFVLAWLVPVVLAFSAFRGKQVQYLLPLVPALALLVAAALATRGDGLRRGELLVLSAVFAALAVALPVLAQQPRVALLVEAHELQRLGWSVGALALAALLIGTAPRHDLVRAVARVGSAAVVAMLGVYAGVGHAAFDAYDLHPVSRHLAAVQRAGHPIANADRYHGQFQLIGRLRQPLAALPEREAMLDWARRHPDGRIVLYSYAPLEHARGVAPEFSQKFKGRLVSVWKASDLDALSDGWTRNRDGEVR
jgi:4-amino-4-deoxy-L-arabinose transferase-like glycosyltransferase